MALRRKTCQHYSDPSEKTGEDGKHYYSGKCISCNEQIVGCLLCNYSFAESAKACYSTDAYFNLHMGRKHKEMLHRSKIQKTNNVSLPEHNDEYDFGDQDNDTTECFDDETSFIVDYVPEEVKEREAKEDDDSVPTLASRAESASDEESVISFEGDDDGKEINDDDDDLDSVIIPNPSDAIADSDYISLSMISLPFGKAYKLLHSWVMDMRILLSFVRTQIQLSLIGWTTISCIFGRNA
jgi:hypothetical protein